MELIPSTTIRMSRATIILEVIFSTPFCSPIEQMPKQSMTVIAMKINMLSGWFIRLPNCSPTAVASKPLKSPRNVLKKYSNNQPVIVV